MNFEIKSCNELPEIYTSSVLPSQNIAGLTISPIKKKKTNIIKSTLIPYPHPLSTKRENAFTIGKVPPIPRFLPSSAVIARPYELLMIHDGRYHTIGIFRDEREASDRRKQLIDQRKQQIKNKQLFLNGNWNFDADYVIRPIPGDDRGLHQTGSYP